MIRAHDDLLLCLRQIHAAIRDAVVTACERTALEQLAVPVAEEAGDTIYAVDRISEAVLLEHFGALAQDWSCVLVAEGLGTTGQMILPIGSSGDPELRIIVDPIDGTRGLMYQRRPAWVLTGVAPNRGPATSLADIELAVQTEIPLVKQHLCDTLWATVGAGVSGERLNRLSGERSHLSARPSGATTIAQGFGSISRFFPGGRDILAAIDEAVVARVLGPFPAGKALAFEDQYISTGGQLYELMMGHDRWVADLRPLVEPLLRRRGDAPGLLCHPYDLCTELIAREAGIVVTDERGARLQAPLDVTSGVSWTGYANRAIAEQVAPALRAALQDHDCWPESDRA